MFATSEGKGQNASNVRGRVLERSIKRANGRLTEADEPPLPALTPHGLRRSFASLLYAIGESPPVVMAEMGHTDPALALAIYAQAMRRDEGENRRLEALVNGHQEPSIGHQRAILTPRRPPGQRLPSTRKPRRSGAFVKRARQDSNLRLLPPEDAPQKIPKRPQSRMANGIATIPRALDWAPKSGRFAGDDGRFGAPDAPWCPMAQTAGE